jgi:hypothetical protein
MSREEEYIIDDIETLTNGVRAIVFNNFGNWDNDEKMDNIESSVDIDPEDKEDIDRVLPYQESLQIVLSHLLKQRNKTTKEIRYIMSEKDYLNMCEEVNSRMLSNLLLEMTNKGIIESAFDSEENDFIFWLPDNKKEN